MRSRFEGDFNGKAVVPFFHLPNLRSLHVHKVVGTDASSSWVADLLSMAGTSSMRRLSFERCDIAPSLLNSMLLLPKKLSYIHCLLAPIYYRFQKCDWNSLSIALRIHSHSLTTIAIYPLRNIEGIPELGRMRSVGKLGSLLEFRALRHVKLPASALFGPIDQHEISMTRPILLSNLLPISLVSLELCLGTAWDFQHFMDLTSYPNLWLHERKNFPALRRFIVHRYRYDRTACNADLSMIEAFEQSGIVVASPLGEQRPFSLLWI